MFTVVLVPVMSCFHNGDFSVSTFKLVEKYLLKLKAFKSQSIISTQANAPKKTPDNCIERLLQL